MKLIYLKLLLSGTFCLFFIQCSNAQVIYTDVIPNSIIGTTNSVYHLDLNNDGIPDYNINFTTGTMSGTCRGTQSPATYYIRITPLDSNEVGTDATSPFYPKVLLLDSWIDSAAFAWKNTANQLLVEKLWYCRWSGRICQFGCWVASYVGTWNNASNKYLPLRLRMGSQVYYGWVRLSIASGVTNATIFDYAYNTSPGQPILAGEPMPQVMNNTLTSTCSNFSFVIPFYAPPGYYNPGNKFIAQLSDYTGSFNNPIILDSISTTTSDTIFATLTSVPLSGNAYKIRILSTDPAITGPPSASHTLIIAPPPPASIVRTFPIGLDSVCASHGTLYLVANHLFGLTYHWYFNGTLVSSSTDSIFNLTSGSGTYSVSVSNICGTSSMSAPFTLFVSPVGAVTLDSFPTVCRTDPPFALTGGHPSGGYYTGFRAVDSLTGMFNPALAIVGNNYVSYTVPDTILPQCNNTTTRTLKVIFCATTSVNEIGSNRASFYSRGKKICVQLSKNYLTDGKILIYDYAGRELKQKNITGEKIEIDMSECSTGIYFVRIQTTMLTETGRVYIE